MSDLVTEQHHDTEHHLKPLKQQQHHSYTNQLAPSITTTNNITTSTTTRTNKKNDAANSDELNLAELRKLLFAGQRSSAVEHTIKHKMWPHALFLESSISSQLSPNKAKLRFMNSLPQNDPILTCYQLFMGRVPSAASVSSRSFSIFY
jgi:hypothetical protein